MSEKRILLMYISEVSGHHNATLAIEKALKTLDPHVSILNINSFKYTNPLLEKIINKAYMGVIKRTPKVWEYLYDNPGFIKKTQRIKDAIHKANFRKFDVLFEEFNPTAVVCTQAFPCGLIADYKRVYGVKVPLIGVLTDFSPHAYWVYNEVDYYIVPSEEAKKRFLTEGIPEYKIKLLGIPIDPRFSRPHSRREIAKRLQLDLSIPTILVMGGGQGIGPIRHIVTALNKFSGDLQVMVVAGTNRKLLKWLEKKKPELVKKFLIFKYVNNIEELMEVASFIISKPGGLTTAEALAKGLPMIIIKPIPGQEENNTEFLLRNGVAIKIDRMDHAHTELERLIKNEGRLIEMQESAQRLGKPTSAVDAARLILRAHV